MKNIIKYNSLLCLFVLFTIGNVIGQEASVSARIDAKQIEIGDQFHLFLEARLPEGSGKLHWANIPQFEGLECVDTGSVDSAYAGKLLIYKQKFTLTGFDSGAFLVPAFDFEWTSPSGKTKNLLTDSIPILVSTLTVDTAAPIMPIKEIEEVEKDWWSMWPYFLAGLVVLVSLVLLVIYGYKKWAKKKTMPKVVEKPDQKALRLLDAIQHKQYEGDDGQKTYYTELTQILRDYLEARYGISIAEMTTDELLKMAKKNGDLRNVRSELKEIFSAADLAKFAKAIQGSEAQVASLEAAKSIIYKTKFVQQEGTAS